MTSTETEASSQNESNFGSRLSVASSDIVSVVIPCFNEARFISQALEQLAAQYDPKHYEILIVDGMSQDNTRILVEQFSQSRPDLTVILIDNPARNIPTALNLGVAAARGNIIARMDAHAVPSSGYIRRCVEVLRQGDLSVVGMPCHVQPGADTLVATAIAGAVSHPFGIGDAKYRLREGAASQEAVDTVAFACFRKSLWEELSGFNEELLTNEDYDFNYRARLKGHRVVLDRSGHCDYFARATLRELARQYWRYGGWKARMVRLHPRSLKWRHLVAPLFILSIGVLALVGVAWPVFWLLLVAELTLYLLLSLGFGWSIRRRYAGGIGMWFLMPVVFMTIHVTWGVSFLLGLLRRPNSPR